ncbi:MAG: calcium/sodium antiporter [Bacteroidales bacterium]|nr:calcium/sodium antiporter [Bacteroidales bacterium]
MILYSLLLILGFALLIKGADWLVTGSSALAKKNNISDLTIGLTIVAFGTSAPELVVNSVAAFKNHPDIVFGNVIGSNIFNLFLILGIVGVIYPISVASSTVWKQIPISFAAIVILYLFANSELFQSSKVLSRYEGLFLLMFFALFLFYVYREMKAELPMEETKDVLPSGLKIWLLIAAGLGGLIFGGKLVVDNGIKLASQLGVSEKIISLTVIAAGTSLPELVTSVVAAFRKKSDIAVGNIIGSNIFNILLILGVSSLVHPLQFSPSFIPDLAFLAGGTLYLFISMFTGKKKKLDRWEAILLLLVFAGYMYRLLR